MAKSSQALLVAALLVGLVGVAYCHDFTVEGKVYCDTCRAMFETRLSKPMVGAPVQLRCRNRENATISTLVDGVTNENGTYKVFVNGEYENDICEVTVRTSTIYECDERVPGKDRARVVLTSNNGVVSKTRYANPLGFLTRKALDECPKVLKELGLLPDVDLRIA